MPRSIPLVFALCAVALACAEPRTPEQAQAREDCLAVVYAAKDARAEQECPPATTDWDTCPARPAIMAEFAAEQRKCR